MAMSLSTSQRYPANSMSKAQARQVERIRQDEIIEAQEQLVKNDLKATQRASWNESLEEASERRSLKHREEEIRQELQLASKALTEVRRSQLRQLLQREQRALEAELQGRGLAFHVNRL